MCALGVGVTGGTGGTWWSEEVSLSLPWTTQQLPGLAGRAWGLELHLPGRTEVDGQPCHRHPHGPTSSAASVVPVPLTRQLSSSPPTLPLPTSLSLRIACQQSAEAALVGKEDK